MSAEIIFELIIEALQTDGAHHKQWYLEQILEKMGCKLEEIRADIEYEEGIAP